MRRRRRRRRWRAAGGRRRWKEGRRKKRDRVTRLYKTRLEDELTRHTTYSTTPYNVHTRCTPYRVLPYSVFLSSVRLTWSEVRASMARRPLTAVVGLAVYMSSFWSLTRLRPFALKRSSCARWGGRRRGVIRVRRSVWSGKSSGRRKASEVGPRNVVVHPDLSSTLCLSLGLSPLSVLSLSAALLLAIMQRFGANLSI